MTKAKFIAFEKVRKSGLAVYVIEMDEKAKGKIILENCVKHL